MQLLLIKLQGLSASPEYALLGKKQAEDHFTPADWDRVRSLSRGRKVVLLIPDTSVALTTVTIPSKNKKQLMQAIPFALEDTLAEDIETLHFASHQNDTDKHSNVAIISRQLLDSYLDLLRNQNITAHYILPQVLSLPIPENGWSMLQSDNFVSVRLDDLNGFHCQNSLLDLFLTEQLEKTEPKLIYSNIEPNQLPESLQEITTEKNALDQVKYNNIISALPLNLISGFVSHKKTSAINWKMWRPTLVLASLVGAIGLGILIWQNNALKHQSQQLNSAINATFKSTFPDSRLVDPPQQMSSKLAQLKNNIGKTVDSPLPLLAEITPLVKDYKDMTLSEVRYQENELTMVMQSPNLTRIETFKKDAAKKAKMNVEIKSSTTTADKVKVILIISPLSVLTSELQPQVKAG